MADLRRAGGVAARIEAATYLVGFALIATVLAPLPTPRTSPHGPTP